MEQVENIKITKHAKKRIKKRVCKAYKKKALEAWKHGNGHSKLKGRLKKYVDRVFFSGYKHPVKISKYIIYQGYLYLFSENTLITVWHIPSHL